MNEQCNLRDKRESAPLVSVVVDTYNCGAWSISDLRQSGLSHY